MTPLLIEFGMGTSLRRADDTEAAARAVRDALWRHSVRLAEWRGRGREEMRMEVTVGVPRPEAVDLAALAAIFPYGSAEIRAVAGGLDVPRPGGGVPTVMANVAIAVSFEAGEAEVPPGRSENVPSRPGSGPDEVRVMLAMGMGVDAGGDPAPAATRAVTEALGRSVLPMLEGRPPRIVVHLGTPGAVPERAVAGLFDGPVEVHVVPGGLALAPPGGVAVQAAVEMFLPGPEA